MSRSRIALLILLSASYHSDCFAQRDASIDGILKPIVAKIASDPNVGSWEWEHNRNGGYLLRMQMDVTGDGRPELFVATTLESSKHAHLWRVFDVTGDGELHPYSTTLNFISATPRTENGLHSLDLLPFPDQERFRVSDKKPYRVVNYSFAYPTIKETTSYVSEADAMKLQPPDVGQLPKLQSILLADYLTKPDAKWADATELKRDASDCFFREEDRERAAKNTAFTPQVALSKLGVVQSSSASSSDQSTGNQPPPVVQTPAPKKAPSTAPAASTPSEAPVSSTPLSIIVVLIVAATGLLWLVLKRRP